MKPREDAEVAAWLAKSHEDLSAVSVLRRHSPELDNVIAFHCQQAAEKLLKALLVAVGSVPPRTHDLAALVLELRSRSADVGPTDADVALLEPHAVLPRYPSFQLPGEPPGTVGREAEEAVRRIEHSVNAVFRRG